MLRLSPLLIFLFFWSSASVGVADVTVDSVLDVTVEDVSLVEEKDGAYRLLFRLVNDSPSEIILLGVEATDAQEGELIYYSHHNAAEPLETLHLQPDEEADFATSHLRARLLGLKVSGDSVPFRLIFRRGWIEGEAHVH